MSAFGKAPYEASCKAPSQASWQGLPRRASYTLPVSLTPSPESSLQPGGNSVAYVGRLLRGSPRVELRHQLHGRWATHWFTDVDALMAKAASFAGSGNLFTQRRMIKGKIYRRQVAAEKLLHMQSRLHQLISEADEPGVLLDREELA